jgi:hypothetical protein
MAIHGTGPLDSETSLSEFRGLLYMIVRRINYYTEACTIQNVENPVLADIHALSLLCKERSAASGVIAKKQVAEWREKFLAHHKSVAGKLPHKYRDGIAETAARIFAEIEEVAVDLPRDMWHKKAGLNG